MGYSYKLGIIKKTDFINIKDKTYSELIELYGEDDSIYIQNLFQKVIFDFGDSLYIEELDCIYGKSIDMFSNNEVNEYLEENKPKLLNSEGFNEIIDIFNDKIATIFNNLSKKDDLKKDDYFKEKIDMWKNKEVLSSLKKKNTLTNSFLYEYSAFELMFIFKTLNVEEDCLIFFGS